VRRSGYSAPHLHRLFGQVTSLSPCRWLRRERVYAAAGLLSTTDKTMVEIAVDVGLEGRSQLHRAFREAMGLSPDQYRRRRRGGGRG